MDPYPYSDGSPFYEFGVAILLLAIFGRVALTPARRSLDFAMQWLASSLRRLGLFSSTISLSAEVRRLDFLRIVFGALVSWHYGNEFFAALAINDPNVIFWFGLTTALSGCVTVGLLTPIATTLLLLSLNILVVNFTLNLSIGTSVIAFCLIPMVVAPAGHTLSIDAVLLRRKIVVPVLYAIWGMPTIDRIQIGRFLALLAFCAINLYSALNHLGSQTWLDGLTTGIVLLFPIIDPSFHGVADAIYSRAPTLYVTFSKFTTYGMLVWQFLLLPLVLFSRPTRIVAIIWGVIFFIFSEHVLNLKVLGVYEYVLFVLVFWSHALIDGRSRHALKIFFDDRCNFFDRTVQILGWLDLFHRLEFNPLSRNIELARQHGVSRDEALIDLVGVSPIGRIYRGYDLYQRIAALVVLTLPLWPVLFVGRIGRIGPMAYRFVVDRRSGSFGVSEFGRYSSLSEWKPVTTRESSTIFYAVVLSFLVLFGAYAARLPIVKESFPDLGHKSNKIFGHAPVAFGLGPIDVFNEADLKLYHNTVQTSFVTSDGKVVLHDFVFSESLGGMLTEDLRVASRAPRFCSISWGDRIARYYATTLTQSDPIRKLLIKTRFLVSTHPSREDMLAYRYAPLTWEPVCTTSASISDPSFRTVEYHGDGMNAPYSASQFLGNEGQ